MKSASLCGPQNPRRFSVALVRLLALISLVGTSAAIESKTAEVGGLRLHYLTAGHGPAVILLHGYTQTSRMWTPVIPLLARKFTVVAPDLPGIGDSAIPRDGIDMKNSAIRLNDKTAIQLVSQLLRNLVDSTQRIASSSATK